jgi:hypothetical protein
MMALGLMERSAEDQTNKHCQQSILLSMGGWLVGQSEGEILFRCSVRCLVSMGIAANREDPSHRR